MKKKTPKETLFERFEKVDPTFKRRINEDQYDKENWEYEDYKQTQSFNPEEAPPVSYGNEEDFTSSTRDGYTNGIPNNEIEDFFNLRFKNSQKFGGADDVPFDVMKDEVLAAMKELGVSSIDALHREFNEMNETNKRELNEWSSEERAHFELRKMNPEMYSKVRKIGSQLGKKFYNEIIDSLDSIGISYSGQINTNEEDIYRNAVTIIISYITDELVDSLSAGSGGLSPDS